MRARFVIVLGMIIVLSGGLTISLSQGQGTGSPPHGKPPSLDCFNCHGTHPPRNAAEMNLANFAIPPHELPRQSVLTCAQCHKYPKEIEEIDSNSCVGCHAKGGYSIAATFAALVKTGHPDVLAMIKTVPKDCSMCHAGTLSLGPRLHKRHFSVSKKFVLHFQTGCFRCHLLDANGKTAMKDYPLK